MDRRQLLAGIVAAPGGSSVWLARPHDLRFSQSDGRTIITFKADGTLEAGEGLSRDAATREMFDGMAKLWPGLVDEWAKARGWVKAGER